MTPEQNKEIVKLAYALYNEELHLVNENTVFNAWYQMLQDCEYVETKEALFDLATHNKYMIKVGELRRAVIDKRNGEPEHLDPYTAWGIFMTVQRDANFGTQTKVPKPEALQKTLERLGSSALSMHTNGDRDVFVRVYNAVVEEMQRQKYKILKKDGRA